MNSSVATAARIFVTQWNDEIVFTVCKIKIKNGAGSAQFGEIANELRNCARSGGRVSSVERINFRAQIDAWKAAV